MSRTSPKSAPKTSKLAEALLDAHVAHVLEQLEGEALDQLMQQELDAGLAAAEKLTLNDAVEAQTIKDTIRTFAVELEVGGGIPELVGDIARDLHGAKILHHTTLGDLLSDARFSEMLDKALEMKPLRERLIHLAVSTPQYQAFASNLIYEGINRYLGAKAVAKRVPGASSMLKLGKAVMSRAAPDLEATLEDGLRKQIRASVKATARASERALRENLDDERIRAGVKTIWQELKPLKVSALLKDISSLDFEEWFVIGYEYWRELRESEIYSTLIFAGVDRFFASYGDRSLQELLDDIGITRELMLGEARRYGPPAIKALKRKGLLEPAIRRNLARFYHSEAASKVISKHLD